MEETTEELHCGRAVLPPATKPSEPEMDYDEAMARVGGEASSSLKSDCHNLSPSRPSTVTSFRSIGQLRSNSIQRFRKQMQRVWKRTPGSSREQGMKMGVNLEAMANQKRQWYQIHSQSQVNRGFFILFKIHVGKRSTSNRTLMPATSYLATQCIELIGFVSMGMKRVLLIEIGDAEQNITDQLVVYIFQFCW